MLKKHTRATWRRRLNQSAPAVSTLTGLFIAYGGFIIFKDDLLQLLAVTMGIVLIEIGVWYGANPVFSSERRYGKLRQEVNRFIYLVRQLNTAVVKDFGNEEVASIKDTMHASVETMHRYAGVPDGTELLKTKTSINQPAQLPR